MSSHPSILSISHDNVSKVATYLVGQDSMMFAMTATIIMSTYTFTGETILLARYYDMFRLHEIDEQIARNQRLLDEI